MDMLWSLVGDFVAWGIVYPCDSNDSKSDHERERRRSGIGVHRRSYSKRELYTMSMSTVVVGTKILWKRERTMIVKKHIYKPMQMVVAKFTERLTFGFGVDSGGWILCLKFGGRQGEVIMRCGVGLRRFPIFFSFFYDFRLFLTKRQPLV